jgi:hypothetical protein
MDAEGWLTGELSAFACAACGEAYGQGRIRLIAQRDELFFVDLTCDHCGSQAVAIVTIQVDGESASLQGGELVRVVAETGPPDRPPVSVDDVLDAHAILEDFHGDVHQLIAHLEGREP